MDILVAYGTVEGQSRRIAERIAEILREAGHAPRLLAAEAEPPPPFPEAIGAAILCAPVHVGHYPRPFEAMVRGWAGRLAALPNAFVSVSLAIIGRDAGERHEAEQMVARMTERTGWTPGAVHHAAGALRYSEYDFFKRWVMRSIARKEGYPEGEDREFTDWAALEAFVRSFVAGLDG